MSKRKVLLAVVVALAAGLAGGYYYRRVRNPTLQERAQDATDKLRETVHEMTTQPK